MVKILTLACSSGFGSVAIEADPPFSLSSATAVAIRLLLLNLCLSQPAFSYSICGPGSV